jgi:hypothetical protein
VLRLAWTARSLDRQCVYRAALAHREIRRRLPARLRIRRRSAAFADKIFRFYNARRVHESLAYANPDEVDFGALNTMVQAAV